MIPCDKKIYFYYKEKPGSNSDKNYDDNNDNSGDDNDGDSDSKGDDSKYNNNDTYNNTDNSYNTDNQKSNTTDNGDHTNMHPNNVRYFVTIPLHIINMSVFYVLFLTLNTFKMLFWIT